MNANIRYFLLLIINMSFILHGCSGGNGNDVINDALSSTADIDGEVYSYKSWDRLSPEKAEADAIEGTSDVFSEIVGIDEFSCSNVKHSLTSNPKEFISIQPDSSIVWLGNLIQGRSHLLVGSLQELSIRERAPMGITIDLLRGDNYRLIQSPSLTSVNAAIGELVENAVAEGHQASSDIYYAYSEAHSSSQALLALGFSGEYLGYQAETHLAVSNEANEHTYYAYFMQKAFTVSMQLPGAPHDVVTDAFSQVQLQELKNNGVIGEDNPPLYISNVAYGRILIYKMTSTHTKERIQAAINASYHGFIGGASGYSEADIQNTLDTSKIEIAAFGGNASNIEALIRSGKLSDYFTHDTALTSMRPISFEIRSLMDNQKAGIVRNTEYDIKTCDYVGKTIPPIGENIKVILERVYIGDDCDGGLKGAGDIYGHFNKIYEGNNGNGVVTAAVYNIPAAKLINVSSGDNLVFDGNWNTFEVVKYYGKRLEVSGVLYDEDGSTDDIVGVWAPFTITDKQPGSYNIDATNNCDGTNPKLFYRVERLDYIYE